MKQKRLEALKDRVFKAENEHSMYLEIWNIAKLSKDEGGMSFQQFKGLLKDIYERKAKKEIVNTLKGRARKEFMYEKLFEGLLEPAKG